MKCSVAGLTHNQVVDRRARGLDNRVQFRATRSYLYILRKNALTFVNAVLFTISLVLILLGQLDDALVTAGLVLLNVCVGIVQEGRAKRKLERIALLARPQATVIRDGREQVVDPAEIVQDDVLVVRPGDQFIADGRLLHASRVEVDESLLTGEADRVRKDPGDPVYSGSFCVSGEGCYQAQKVGANSLVNQLAARVRTFRQVKTPLQRDIDYVIRILVILVAQFGILMALSFAIQGMPLVEGVRAAAVIVALVPQGLFFMTTVSYALGALRVAGQGALIQELNAVESSSNVDLLCLDKTGTLTSNRIRLESMVLLGGTDEDAMRCLLGDFAASAGGGNRTMSALHQAFGGQSRPIEVEVPFSSEHRWSALLFHEAAARGANLRGPFYLGAPEVLQPQLGSDPNLASQVDLWTNQGLRVLLFARGRETAHLYDAAGQPQVPLDLLPLALLSFRDELRPEARETLTHFAELGIGLKIISGDRPETVAALARQVLANGEPSSLLGKLCTVSGIDLEGMEPARLAQVAAQTTIFGRITPQQKQTLVGLFRRQGHYVAMIGDGVNDVLSLKEADLAVTMQSGSQAARSLADVVLLSDSFAALSIAFREGQRIVRGMEDVVRLLLTRTP
jgi:cation-transporting ATPase E